MSKKVSVAGEEVKSEAGRDRTRWGLLGCEKDLGFYFRYNEKLLEVFK